MEAMARDSLINKALENSLEVSLLLRDGKSYSSAKIQTVSDQGEVITQIKTNTWIFPRRNEISCICCS